METPESGAQPTPEQARTALAAARAEESATINRPMPGWYYPVLAGLLFSLFALNAIDEPTGAIRVVTVVLALVLAVGIGALAGKTTGNQPGYRGIRIPWGPTILATLVAAAFPVAAIVLDDVFGSWVWLASGAGLALFILIIGMSYQRKYRNG